MSSKVNGARGWWSVDDRDSNMAMRHTGWVLRLAEAFENRRLGDCAFQRGVWRLLSEVGHILFCTAHNRQPTLSIFNQLCLIFSHLRTYCSMMTLRLMSMQMQCGQVCLPTRRVGSFLTTIIRSRASAGSCLNFTPSISPSATLILLLHRLRLQRHRNRLYKCLPLPKRGSDQLI